MTVDSAADGPAPDLRQHDLQQHWPALRRLAVRAFRSHFHCAVATVDADGRPRATPIGSLLLDRSAPRGLYFEIFTAGLRRNLERGSRVTVLMVDGGTWFWVRSLVAGRFATPPAARLHGVAGARRPSTAAERRRWQRRVRPLAWTRGHREMWGELATVREIVFDGWEPVRLGRMTRRL